MKPFGDWLADQANSIVDASEVKKEEKPTIAPHGDALLAARQRAILYSRLKNGEPKDGIAVAGFFMDYCQFLAGTDLFYKFEMISHWDPLYNTKMFEIYEELEEMFKK